MVGCARVATTVMRLGSASLVCGALACADGESSVAQGEQQDTLPPGTVEPRFLRRRSPRRSTRPVRAGSSMQMLPAASPEQAGAYAAYQDAEEAWLAAYCSCEFDAVGHPSAEACFERSREPEFAQACARLAFEPFAVALAPRYACLTPITESGTACLAEQGCGASRDCLLLMDATARTCGEPLPDEFSAFELLTTCERQERLGTPSGCPDYPSLESLLGSRILEGDTTGKGDDVTLSCHPEIEIFESADVMVEWEATAAGTYRFVTSGSTFFTQLGVLGGCGGPELACSSSAGRVSGSTEIVMELAAMQRVMIVIEGFHVTETGYFALSVSREPE